MTMTTTMMMIHTKGSSVTPIVTDFPKPRSSRRTRFSLRKWFFLSFAIVQTVLLLSNLAFAVPDKADPSMQRQQQHHHLSREEATTEETTTTDDGLIQIIESEVWDATENVWKGGTTTTTTTTEGGNNHRWTNEKGKISPSPAEVVPPKGWEFLGDWKIVVGSGSSGDSKGWEYQFQYLQPPKRRRIWLRSLTPTKAMPFPPPVTPKSTIAKRSSRTNRLSKTLKAIQDDWNYKGLGFNIWKSFLFPSSFGCGLRVPLSINFDTFDRNPSWPILSSSVAAFYPPMVVGFLTTSFHVEWVKWMILYALGLIPRSILWVVYRLILPLIWTMLTMVTLPVKGWLSLPPLPKKIPSHAWWTGRNLSKPKYNPELSERIGCSVSYRWSKKRGYEWRVSYWHAYLPTLLAYQRLVSQIREKLHGSSSDKEESSSSSSSSSKTNWWRKHTASLGVSTSGPIPDTPPLSCSANFSLSGLYWGALRTFKPTPVVVSVVEESPRTEETHELHKNNNDRMTLRMTKQTG